MRDKFVITQAVVCQEGPKTQGTRNFVQKDCQEDKETQPRLGLEVLADYKLLGIISVL